MAKIKLGIEKTIVGSFFLISFMFFILGVYESEGINWKLLFETTSSQDRLSMCIVFIALSYLFGSVADVLSYVILVNIRKIAKQVLLKILPRKWHDFLSSFGEQYDPAEFTIFLQFASEEIANEFNLMRGQNILFRVLSAGWLALGFSISYWLHRIKERWSIILILSILLFILFVIAYWFQKREFVRFRTEAFIGIKQVIEKTSLLKESCKKQDRKESSII